MIDDAIQTLRDGAALSEGLSYATFSQIMRGEIEDERIMGLLALLAQRPVMIDELTGAARVMREHVTPVPVSPDPDARVIDTCGTGGAPKAFNVSTVAALIAAGAGRMTERTVRVAKHGNRSRTGRGSAEVLMALGVNADASPEVQARCLEEAGVCFCFAIHHHPAIKHAMPARRALEHPTIFNLLGPLTNPAGAQHQLIGCFDKDALETMASTLKRLGSSFSIVCRGDDGLDEMTTTTTTTACYVSHDGVHRATIDPASCAIDRVTLAELQVSDVEESARVVRDILSGERGPRTDIALLNAGAALLVSQEVLTLESGVDLARDAIATGNAMDALEDLKRVSHA